MEESIKVINTANAGHYNWGNLCDGWHLVQRDELSIIKEKMPPGASEARHYHQKSRQFFYILTGRATMEVQDKKYFLFPSDGIEIPPLVPHKIRNESEEEMNFIVVSQPESHKDRVIVEK
jgi:mannose-6-phosphate isomerase-like protein (cupin superfamily)